MARQARRNTPSVSTAGRDRYERHGAPATSGLAGGYKRDERRVTSGRDLHSLAQGGFEVVQGDVGKEQGKKL